MTIQSHCVYEFVKMHNKMRCVMKQNEIKYRAMRFDERRPDFSIYFFLNSKKPHSKKWYNVTY